MAIAMLENATNLYPKTRFCEKHATISLITPTTASALSFLVAAGADAPKVAADDMNAISIPVEFVGINVYLPGSYVSASDAAPGFVSVPFPAKYPTMNSSWLKIGPEALYWGPRNVAKLWNVSDIYITENGCSATDVPAADGIVYDTDRIMFLRSYLTQLQRATSEGVTPGRPAGAIPSTRRVSILTGERSAGSN